MAITGGCMCGAIRYEVTGEPITGFVCHCRACQYASGGAGANVMIVSRADSAILHGQPRTYWSRSDSGAQIGRQFCEECGTPLFSDLEAQPDLVIIKVGSLDDPTVFKPSANLWASAAQPWHKLDEEIPSFPQGPAASR
jgi:hypothetical protein